MIRRGVVLVAVLVITALAAMVAASMTFRMRAEVMAASATQAGQQARAAAMSGIRLAMQTVHAQGEKPDVWWDDPQRFRNRLVCDDGANRWYFTVYAADPSEPDRLRCGLTDEGGKLNVNSATAEALTDLPNMTPERVDCLLDYLDRDDETRPYGAEQDYYNNLPQPYLIRNGPLATLEELLLIKGFDASVVWGEDANLSGRLEPNEDDAEESFPPDNADGLLDAGLRGLLTVAPPPDRPQPDRRIDINGDPEQLNLLDDSELDPQTAAFIRLYRTEGNLFNSPADLLEMTYTLREDHEAAGDFRAGDQIASGVSEDDLPLVLEALQASSPGATHGPAETAPGPVNVNTAPEVVLAALPGMDRTPAKRIVDARSTLGPEARSSLAWLRTEGIVSPETFARLRPSLAVRSSHFRVQCAGFAYPGGTFRVLEAVIDVSGERPRLTYVRDLTRLGLPFEVHPEDLEGAE